MIREKFIQAGIAISAFFMFALSLAIPTGYSYGSLGLLSFALMGCRSALSRSLPSGTWLLVCLFLLMGGLWSMGFEGLFSWNGTDYWLKYWLAAFTLAIVSIYGVRGASVEWGVAAGAVGALGIAAYQYLVLGWSKAWGYTNAIQFGDLAMYLGLAAWAVALFGQRRWAWTVLMWLCGACGVIASLLSETRGAWVVAPLLLLCVLIVLCIHGRVRLAISACVASSVLVAVAVLPHAEKFGTRATEAVHELEFYGEDPHQAAVTSVGQRLEQWRTAVRMIEERPVTGWGTEGVIARKQELVNQGMAHPSIMDYGHTHNEILDMWVKRGIVGLCLLTMCYVLPLLLFWPSRQRLQRISQDHRPKMLALRMSASLLPVAYFGFGWTQVLFAHNSGHMFYMFGIVAFWGAIQQLEQSELQLS